MVQVIEVSKQSFHLFNEVPKTLYPADSPWWRNHEVIDQSALIGCYVALKEGSPIGRAALYRQPGMKYHAEDAWFVGNYECAEQPDAAHALLTYIAFIARKGNASYLIGPINGSTWENYRFNTSHIHPLFLFEPYHKLYYNEQFVANDFHVIARYSSNITTDLSFNDKRILIREHDFFQEGVKIRGIDVRNMEVELDQLYHFTNFVFQGNFLYNAIDKKTFVSKYHEVLKVIDHDYVLLAENKIGEIIGFIFSYDDRYAINGKSLIIKTLARHPAERHKGLGHVLANRVIRLAKERGFCSVVHAFIIEQGDATAISANFIGNPYKRYVLYGRKI